MSGNASSSDDPLSSPPCSSLMFTAFTLTLVVLVFPLFAAVLYLGVWRWRQRSHVSHSDAFAYHAVVMETVMALWSLAYCFGSSGGSSAALIYGDNVFFTVWSTTTHFHALTCVEQYLAVVHPVAYLRMRHAGGVRLRNLSVVCGWLCFAGGISAALTSDVADNVFYYSLLLLVLLVVSFCCTRVLRVLRRPGPARRADPRRRRAFLTIVAILAALLLSLGGMLLGGALGEALHVEPGQCVAATEVWFSLPGSLILPLLYLQRAGNTRPSPTEGHVLLKLC